MMSVFYKVVFLRPMLRNSILEELKVRRFADTQKEICCRTFWRWTI